MKGSLWVCCLLCTAMWKARRSLKNEARKKHLTWSKLQGLLCLHQKGDRLWRNWLHFIQEQMKIILAVP